MHTPSTWKTTTPSKLFSEVVHPRRVAPYPARKPQPTSMTPVAHMWLARVPPRFQPLATARRHPHIVNRFCEIWDQPEAVGEYFRSLLLSSRPDRGGFSFEILSELVDLQTFYDERNT